MTFCMRWAREVSDCARAWGIERENRIKKNRARERGWTRDLFFKRESSQNSLATVLMHQAARTDGVELLEGNIQDRVLLPVLAVEMPPFGFVDGEVFGFHGAAKQITVPALERGAAGIAGRRSRRHFIVGAGHLNGLAAGESVEREIHGTAAVVALTLSGIGDVDFAFGGSGVPEDFCDIPGTRGVVDQQAVAERLELLLDTQQRFGGGALEKGAGLGIDGRSEKIVRRGVADVEMN